MNGHVAVVLPEFGKQVVLSFRAAGLHDAQDKPAIIAGVFLALTEDDRAEVTEQIVRNVTRMADHEPLVEERPQTRVADRKREALGHRFC